MNHASDHSAATIALSLTAVPSLKLVARFGAVLRQWRQLSRSRRELAALDDYQLRDLGLSRSQAQFEAGKPFLREWLPVTLRLPDA